MCACGGQRLLLGLGLHCVSIIHRGRFFQSNPELAVMASLTLGLSCRCLPSLELLVDYHVHLALVWVLRNRTLVLILECQVL